MRCILPMHIVLALLLVMLALLVVPASSHSAPGAAQDDSLEATTEPLVPCGPVTFPHGAITFVNPVVDNQPVITADNRSIENDRIPQALGPPNDVPSSYVLGGSQLTLQLLDNVFTADGNAAPELWIGDVGDEGSRHLWIGDGL